MRKRLSARLWKDESLVSVERMLDTQAKSIEADLQTLEPVFRQARETMQQFVLTIPKIARAAATRTDQSRAQLDEENDSQKQQERDDEMPSEDNSRKDRLDEALELTDATIAALVDRANQADLLDDQQRQGVRDADVAAEMLQSTSKETRRALDNGRFEELASDLEKLSQQLSLVAEHFEALESGEPAQSSRQRLQEETEGQPQDSSFEDALARTEALANAANQDPEELLKQLEQTLQGDEAMQRELDRIARDSVAAAEQLLRENGEAEQQLARDLERSDGTLLEKKTRLSQQLQMAVRELMEARSTLLDPSRSASQRGEDPTSVILANQATEKTGEAATFGAKTGAHLSLRELLEAGAEFSGVLQEAQKLIEDAARVAGVQSKRDLFRNQDRRKNAARQSDQQARQIRSRRKQSTEKMEREWAKLRRQAGTRLQANLRVQREVQNKIRALERDDKQPSSEKNIQQTEKLESRLERLKLAEEEIRKTIENQRQEEELSSDRGKQIANETIPDLDQLNPASQLAERLLDTASESLEEIQRRLLRPMADSVDPNSFRAPEQSVLESVDQQNRIARELEEITELIQRAGRHETRLDKEDVARQLRQAASGLENVAEADSRLRAASKDSAESPDAITQIEKAADALQSQSEDIRQLLSEMDGSGQEQSDPLADPGSSETPENSQSSQPRSGDVSDENLQSRKLAKTLDELDRSVNSTTTPSFEPDRGKDSATAENTKQSTSSDDRPADASGSQAGNMALESSPTLAQAVRDQQQDLARNRQQAMLPSPFRKNSGEGQGNGPSQSGSVAGARSDSAMPDGKSLDTTNVVRTGSAWGQLREQRSEDVVTEASDLIAPQYRADVEAYFRAIAAQSGNE